MFSTCILSLAAAAVCCHAAVINSDQGQPFCEQLNFTLTVRSNIKDVAPAPNLTAPGAVETYELKLLGELPSAPNVTRNGVYTLVGQYCRPQGTAHETSPLQVLSHGSTYTKEYWDRGAWGNLSLANSWQRYAARQGYATLAIDRNCNGASSHPDPQLDCQLSTSIEVFHALFSALRGGTASPKIPKTTELAFVGHSAGSIEVSNFVQTYPQDVHTAILTGWPSGPVAQVFAAQYYARHNITPPAAAAINGAFRPAAIGSPARFAGLNQGYIITTNSTFRSVGYSGNYDHSLLALDEHTKGTSPLGEASYTGVNVFPAFEGRVLVVTGDLDEFAWADKDVIADSEAAFPAASSFDWVHAEQAGHMLNYHTSARATYRKVFGKLRYDGPGA